MKEVIDILFSLLWGGGRVIASKRGSSTLSLPTGTVSKFGKGWGWNKEWVVKVDCDVTTTIPTYILACGDVWRIKNSGAPTLCFMCVDVLHQIKDCTAVKREEAVMQQWDVSMGSNVDRCFFNEARNGMSEETFKEEQKKNVRNGNEKGVRRKG